MNKKITREIVLYVFFGALTTLINILSYWLCYYVLSISNTVSTIISWFFSVVFAYFTNRVWVFESKNKSGVKESINFFLLRISTGLFDLLVMYTGVELLNFEGGMVKIISNAIVIVLNYIVSKLFVFKKS